MLSITANKYSQLLVGISKTQFRLMKLGALNKFTSQLCNDTQ